MDTEATLSAITLLTRLSQASDTPFTGALILVNAAHALRVSLRDYLTRGR